MFFTQLSLYIKIRKSQIQKEKSSLINCKEFFPHWLASKEAGQQQGQLLQASRRVSLPGGLAFQAGYPPAVLDSLPSCLPLQPSSSSPTRKEEGRQGTTDRRKKTGSPSCRFFTDRKEQKEERRRGEFGQAGGGLWRIPFLGRKAPNPAAGRSYRLLGRERERRKDSLLLADFFTFLY